MNLPVKIASRSSPLALVQIEEILQELKAKGTVFDYETVQFETAGDKDKTTPLTDSSDDFFTDAIDQALLEGKADIAIHSAKDLPQNLHEDLKIFALTQGLDDQRCLGQPCALERFAVKGQGRHQQCFAPKTNSSNAS